MLRTLVIAVVVGLVLVIGVGQAEAAPVRPVDTHQAAEWSDTAIGLLVTNKKVISRCVGYVALESYGPGRALSANALRSRISDIWSLAQAFSSPSCRTTVQVAKAALRLWEIGRRDGRSFTFSDDSKVVVRPGLLPNDCYFDVRVGDATTGSVARYQASYRMCSKSTYGSTTKSDPGDSPGVLVGLIGRLW